MSRRCSLHFLLVRFVPCTNMFVVLMAVCSLFRRCAVIGKLHCDQRRHRTRAHSPEQQRSVFHLSLPPIRADNRPPLQAWYAFGLFVYDNSVIEIIDRSLNRRRCLPTLPRWYVQEALTLLRVRLTLPIRSQWTWTSIGPNNHGTLTMPSPPISLSCPVVRPISRFVARWLRSMLTPTCTTGDHRPRVYQPL